MVLLGLLGVACATTEAQKGRSGPVLWEVLGQTQAQQGDTLVLRETTGLGIQFTTVRTAVPLPPTAYGREYYGGIEEAAFVRRLEPLGELRVVLRRLLVPNPPR